VKEAEEIEMKMMISKNRTKSYDSEDEEPSNQEAIANSLKSATISPTSSSKTRHERSESNSSNSSAKSSNGNGSGRPRAPSGSSNTTISAPTTTPKNIFDLDDVPPVLQNQPQKKLEIDFFNSAPPVQQQQFNVSFPNNSFSTQNSNFPNTNFQNQNSNFFDPRDPPVQSANNTNNNVEWVSSNSNTNSELFGDSNQQQGQPNVNDPWAQKHLFDFDKSGKTNQPTTTVNSSPMGSIGTSSMGMGMANTSVVGNKTTPNQGINPMSNPTQQQPKLGGNYNVNLTPQPNIIARPYVQPMNLGYQNPNQPAINSGFGGNPGMMGNPGMNPMMGGNPGMMGNPGMNPMMGGGMGGNQGMMGNPGMNPMMGGNPMMGNPNLSYVNPNQQPNMNMNMNMGMGGGGGIGANYQNPNHLKAQQQQQSFKY